MLHESFGLNWRLQGKALIDCQSHAILSELLLTFAGGFTDLWASSHLEMEVNLAGKTGDYRV
jgi:hypothetical protein